MSAPWGAHNRGMDAPRLSVVVVVGRLRHRGQRVVDAIAAQTAADDLELVVIDVAETQQLELARPDGLRVTYRRRPEIGTWPQARLAGLDESRADTVAFLEDHCYPEREWAAAVLAAHGRGAAVVGYAFANANPQTYIARCGLMADYGRWAHPARPGPTPILPGNNVSYRRDALIALGDQLERAVAVDFNLHELLRDRGAVLTTEPAAVAAHENFTSFIPMFRANHTYCRLLAANRVRTRGWGLPRRLLWGLATPFGSPLVSVARLASSLRGRRELWPTFAVTLPGALLIWAVASVGEARGYLTGAGDAERAMLHWEAEAVRQPT
jgi:Glycosyl transferase family 2